MMCQDGMGVKGTFSGMHGPCHLAGPPPSDPAATALARLVEPSGNVRPSAPRSSPSTALPFYKSKCHPAPNGSQKPRAGEERLLAFDTARI